MAAHKSCHHNHASTLLGWHLKTPVKTLTPANPSKRVANDITVIKDFRADKNLLKDIDCSR